MPSLSGLPEETQELIFRFLPFEERIDLGTSICKLIRQIILNIPPIDNHSYFSLNNDPFNRLGQRINKIKITDETYITCLRNQILLRKTDNTFSKIYTLTTTPISAFDSFVHLGHLYLYLGNHQGKINGYQFSFQDHKWTLLESANFHKTTIFGIEFCDKDLITISSENKLTVGRLEGECKPTIKIQQAFAFNYKITALHSCRFGKKYIFIVGTALGQMLIYEKSHKTWKFSNSYKNIENPYPINMIKSNHLRFQILTTHSNGTIEIWSQKEKNLKLTKTIKFEKETVTAIEKLKTKKRRLFLSCTNKGHIFFCSSSQKKPLRQIRCTIPKNLPIDFCKVVKLQPNDKTHTLILAKGPIIQHLSLSLNDFKVKYEKEKIEFKVQLI